MRHAADALIGLPWKPAGASRAGVSCWGLVTLFYRDVLGVELTNFEHAPDDVAAITEEFVRERDSGRWQEVVSPADGDVVTMAHRAAPRHFGVYAAGRVLHITQWMREGVVAETRAQLAQRGFGHLQFWRRAISA